MRTSTSVFSFFHSPYSRATLWGSELVSIDTSSTRAESAKLKMAGMQFTRPLASYTESRGFRCLHSFGQVAPRHHILLPLVLQVHLHFEDMSRSHSRKAIKTENRN